jgi:hypothetical protein
LQGGLACYWALYRRCSPDSGAAEQSIKLLTSGLSSAKEAFRNSHLVAVTNAFENSPMFSALAVPSLNALLSQAIDKAQSLPLTSSFCEGYLSCLFLVQLASQNRDFASSARQVVKKAQSIANSTKPHFAFSEKHFLKSSTSLEWISALPWFGLVMVQHVDDVDMQLLQVVTYCLAKAALESDHVVRRKAMAVITAMNSDDGVLKRFADDGLGQCFFAAIRRLLTEVNIF